MSKLSANLTVSCEVRYTDNNTVCPTAVVATMKDVDSHNPQRLVMAPGETGTVVTPAKDPAQYLLIQTPRPINVRINGSVTSQRVERFLHIFGTEVSQVEIDNNLQMPAKQLELTVIFASGGGYL